MSIRVSEADGVRSLHFDTPWIQGSMRIARPYALELEYTQHMMWPLVMHKDRWPKRVLMIGLGAGSMLKFLLRHRPEAEITVVEIDPDMARVAEQLFKVPAPGERYVLFIQDGMTWLQDSQERFDLILVDGFDLNAKAHHLESEAFYALCRDHLKDRGMLSCNLLTLHRQHRFTKKNLSKIFGAGLQFLPRIDEGNVVALAQLTPWKWPSEGELEARVETLRTGTRLNLHPLRVSLST